MCVPRVSHASPHHETEAMINGVSPSRALNAIASKTSAELCTEFGAEHEHHGKQIKEW